MQVDRQAALVALREYRQHRNLFDQRDWEIERIYRAISKGKTVISVRDAIVSAGIDAERRPRLAICRADASRCVCTRFPPPRNEAVYGTDLGRSSAGAGKITIPWPGLNAWGRIGAIVPRIPPQHRPAAGTLAHYHVLWEADWTAIPKDPYLLRRIGKDAWVVVAAWELTDVELSVLRAHQSAH
jgi:hypothetical protein